MKTGPGDVLLRTTNMLENWHSLRPAKTFGGYTLDQFKEICQPALAARAELRDLEARTKLVLAQRHAADLVVLKAMQRVTDGVRGDPEEGADGAFWSAIGYVRSSQRSSGLTRRNGKQESKMLAGGAETAKEGSEQLEKV
jgi:hypothetical protein